VKWVLLILGLILIVLIGNLLMLGRGPGAPRKPTDDRDE